MKTSKIAWQIFFVSFMMFHNASAASAPTEVIDGIEWTITSDTGTQTLDQTSTTAFGIKPVDKTQVKGKVVIPTEVDGVMVSRIADYAFKNCVDLTEVVIPKGIEGIGRFAFEGCENLRYIDLGEVKYICAGVLMGTSNLKSLALPASLQWIDKSSLCSSASYDNNAGKYHYFCGLSSGVAICGGLFDVKNASSILRGWFTLVYVSEESHDILKTWLLENDLVFNLTYYSKIKVGWSNPTFEPKSGIVSGYGNVISIDSASTNSTAKVYYTLDGSTPTNAVTANCHLYSNPIEFTGRMTIKAASYVDIACPYAEVSTLEVGLGCVSDTIIESSLGEEFDKSGNMITLSCETEDVNIRYTLDENEPTKESTLYTGPFAIDDTTTVKAKAFKADWVESETATATFTREWYTVETPVITPDDTMFENTSQEVSIGCDTDGATIYYTIDGSDPRENGREYKHPFMVYNTCTVRAIAAKDDWKDSVEATATFTRGETLSAAANLYGYTMGSGESAWSVDGEVSHDGVSSIRSNGDGSYVQTSVRGAGTLSFWWRAMCEEPDGGEYYDYGVFKVGGTDATYIAGNDTGWLSFSTNITTTGKHTLRWEYRKDDEGTFAPDCVWVDQVQWVPEDGSGTTLTTPEPVPYSWFAKYQLGGASDFETLGNSASGKIQGGHPTSMWEEYVAGTDPTDEDDVLKANISFDEEGNPVISALPKLTDDEIAMRLYRRYGKVTLNDAVWTEIPDGEEDNYNFFKISVEMK